MQPYKIDFQAMPWESPMDGVKCKLFCNAGKRIRLIEYGKAMPVHWCEKGHYGLVLEGSLEIEYPAGKVVYQAGDGVCIPDGPEHKHKGKVLTDTATVVFVEDI